MTPLSSSVPPEEEPVMNKEASETINRMRAVTISRDYGSGGGEIAARLARRLGWQVVDHAIVERVASELGTSLEEAEAHDESTSGIIAQILTSLQNLYPAYALDAPPEAFLSAEEYGMTEEKIVRAAATRGHVVIVGRASQVILADRRDVLHVRIIAPFEQRVAYLMQREGPDRHAAEARIHHKDHERARYLEREYHHKPDEAQLYDLVLNTSLLDLESAVDIICLSLQEKATGLAKTTGELGPATGLSRYPAAPADFPSLAH
jgi:CMP/dCMP kinase